METRDHIIIGIWVFLSVGFLAFLTTVGMVGCPMYNVYSQRKAGEGVLAHAQYSREVAVAEAKAKMESASLLADAEVARHVPQ